MPGRRPIPLARAAASCLTSALPRAWSMLGRVSPAVVVGFGGYPSCRPWAATPSRLPTVFHEQNGVGPRQWLLAPRVDRLATGFRTLVRLDPRLRHDHLHRQSGAAAKLSPPPTPYPRRSRTELRLLVFGGSQGARVIAEIVPAAMSTSPPTCARAWRLFSRPAPRTSTRSASLRPAWWLPSRAVLLRLAGPHGRRHLVISRSGASTWPSFPPSAGPPSWCRCRIARSGPVRECRRPEFAGGAIRIEQPDFTPDASPPRRRL